jgi:thiopeptide-type bacteriocin biosynthesis protein
MQKSGWLYYKIYVEKGSAGIEHMITKVVPRVLATYPFDRWFFLRYLDAKGLHVRLRLRTTEADSLESAGEAILPILNEGLVQLTEVSPTAYRPTIESKRDTSFVASVATRSIETDTYRPETESFGAHGALVAEELFQISSETAMRILQKENQKECSRKTLVPLLMQEVVEAFVLNEAPSVFWRRYAAYWLSNGEAQEISFWSERFRSKANEIKASGVPVLVSASELSEGLQACLAHWRAGLLNAASAYRSLNENQARRPGYLAFHFIHLMNNRLGILPLEESYFATLLADEGRRCAV